MWFKSCEASIGQKKSGTKPDSKEALLPTGDRLARRSRREKWQVMWRRKRQVERLGQWDSSEQRCVTVQEEFLLKPESWDIWGWTHDTHRSLLLSVWTAAHPSLSSSGMPYSGPSLNGTKLFFSTRGAANQLLLIWTMFVSRWTMSLRGGFKYTTWVWWPISYTLHILVDIRSCGLAGLPLSNCTPEL